MYASIRRYQAVTDPELAARRVKEEFVPLISALDGFVAYFWVDAGGGSMLSTSVFESEAATDESNKKAAAWVKANLPDVLPRPEVFVGTVVAQAFAAEHAAGL